MPSPRRATLRTAVAMALVSVWMFLLLAGWVLGGALHLVLLAALVFFPWRWLRAEPGADPPEPSP